jgi:hypothetical protein
MSVIEINRNPSGSDLRTFGRLLPLFGAVVAASVWWRSGSSSAAAVVGGVLMTVAAMYWAVPPLRRSIYVGWLYVAFPIGWTVSHIVMAAIYYLVMTPVGIGVRSLRGDPLGRKFDASARTYWQPRKTDRDAVSYLREF